ncbi:DAK2 domain-containing protein [Peptococcus simiae]|uniref:DAK2 domain-containing protein n=1 Tax=Peptococcus simiae TaxID=1643805 RepID=UPI0039813673
MSSNKPINGDQFIEMIASAANWLEQKRENVDRLNVFPVPDGDTGTNMSMTMRSADKFVKERADQTQVGDVAAQMAYGALMGARGNSGVILSQILSGISQGLKGKTVAEVSDLVQAFALGADAAYKAVTNPMEGTVLTVVREASEALNRSYKPDMGAEEALSLFLQAGYASLNRTPDLLPVLKQAGVVDAGGQGLLFIFEGFLAALQGKPAASPVIVEKEPVVEDDFEDTFEHFFADLNEIIYPYCTEFLVLADGSHPESPIEALKNYLTNYGDCMLVVGTDDLVKVHIHTNDLGAVFSFASQFGELTDIKINNMREQNRALQAKGKAQAPETSEYVVIAVATGDGLAEVFKSLGASYVIHGGQTMNPSTQDFLDAMEAHPAEHTILLPNNKNIIMTAEQAAKLVDGDVRVIPSRTLPQGLAALMQFLPEQDIDNNASDMEEALANVLSGEITTAVRDTSIEGVDIKKDAFLAILEGKIIAAEKQIGSSLEAIIQKMADNHVELITLYYGADIAEDEVNGYVEKLSDQYTDIDFEAYRGGQDVYPYIISAE